MENEPTIVRAADAETVEAIAFGFPGGPEIVVILGVLALTGVAFMLPAWFICKRAGFSPWMSLLVWIPSGVGITVVLFILAFAQWPSQEVER